MLYKHDPENTGNSPRLHFFKIDKSSVSEKLSWDLVSNICRHPDDDVFRTDPISQQHGSVVEEARW